MRKILVIDDESHIRNVITLRMQEAGFEVKSVSNGRAGIDILKDYRPDLIVSDYNMPGGINGIEVIKKTREVEHPKETPIILLTGSVTLPQKLSAKYSNIREVLLMPKPFSLRKLLSVIIEILDNEG